MEDNYKCFKCRNTKKFYREVSVPAKLRLDNEDNTEGQIYDIDIEQFDNEFVPIYCAICGECVDDGGVFD